eukprot:g11836.t1
MEAKTEMNENENKVNTPASKTSPASSSKETELSSGWFNSRFAMWILAISTALGAIAATSAFAVFIKANQSDATWFQAAQDTPDSLVEAGKINKNKNPSGGSSRQSGGISVAVASALGGLPCGQDMDIILEWNIVMMQANAIDHAINAPAGTAYMKKQQPGPVLTSRAMAITHAAMYDAYNSIEKIGDSILIEVPGAGKAVKEVAVAKAASDVLTWLYSQQYMSFVYAYEMTLANYPPGKEVDDAIYIGKTVAKAYIDARKNDGADSINSPPYVPNGQPGFHDVDPRNPNQGFYGPDAGSVTPFVINSASAFQPTRTYITDRANRAAFLQSQEYTEAFNEVKTMGAKNSPQRTEDQTKIAIFWGYDGRPMVGTPPRLYNQAARAIAIQECNSVAENARLFALVNLAMADTGIAVWKHKYNAAFWRPTLGIRKAGTDGNPNTDPDTAWEPLGSQASNPYPGEIDFTPSFPAYTSGHSGFGAAVFTILKLFYARDDIPFTLISDEYDGYTMGSDQVVREPHTRSFTSFTAAMNENAISRVYQGVHWRSPPSTKRLNTKPLQRVWVSTMRAPNFYDAVRLILSY